MKDFGVTTLTFWGHVTFRLPSDILQKRTKNFLGNTTNSVKLVKFVHCFFFSPSCNLVYLLLLLFSTTTVVNEDDIGLAIWGF